MIQSVLPLEVSNIVLIQVYLCTVIVTFTHFNLSIILFSCLLKLDTSSGSRLGVVLDRILIPRGVH